MIIYSVTVAIDPGVELEWADWMQRVHIPDVLRTGCFSECRMYKGLDVGEEQPSYTMQYRCESLADYHRYRDIFAAALQKDHSERFGGRFRASRQLLEELCSAAAPA